MPTIGERVAVIEERVRELQTDVTELRQMIGDRRNPDSIRGRLHKIEGLLGSFVVRRSPGLILKGWERAVVVLCGVATAAAAWYAVLH